MSKWSLGLWEKAFSLIKHITGDVDVSGNGSLQEQIDKHTEDLSRQLREYCDCSLFAQSIIDAYVDDAGIYGAQSMTAGTVDGTDCMLVLFTTSTAESNKDVAVLYDLSTGAVIRYATDLNLGHCNGVTFNTKDTNFYVACAGGKNGLNQVAVLSSELEVTNVFDFSNKEVSNPYAIAYNQSNKSFYLLCSGNVIVEMDIDFKYVIQKSILRAKSRAYTAQGIHYDGRYISFIYNAKDASYCDLYDTRLNFRCSQFINNFGELECGCHYKDELYLLVNTSNSGLILKSSQYRDGKTFDFWNYRHASDRLQVSDAITDLYFNSNATNFFLDGSMDFPFRKLYLGWSYMVGQPISNVRMNLIGDFSKSNINIKKYLGRLYIRGYGDALAKIGGIYIRNFGNISMECLSIVKRNDVENALVSLYYGHAAYLNNISFDGVGTEAYLLRVVGGKCEAENSHFNSDAEYSVFAMLGAFVYCGNGNTYTGSGTAQSYSGSGIQMGYRAPMRMLGEEYANQTVIGGATYGEINLAELTKEGKYRIEGSTTVTNCPEEFVEGGFNLSVIRFDRSVLYNLVAFQTGIPYIGVLGQDATEILWYTMNMLKTE